MKSPMPKKKIKQESAYDRLARVRKEMAKPRVAKSAREVVDTNERRAA